MATPQISFKRKKSAELELKPVFGEGRAARWEAVKNIFQNQITPLYGDQSELLQAVEKENNLKCRLLQSDEKPAGVLIYSTELSKIFEKEACLEIKTLYAQDQHSADEPKDLSAFLLNEVLAKAKELGARTLIIKVSKTSMRFFQDNHFVLIRDRESFAWLHRTVADKASEPEKLPKLQEEWKSNFKPVAFKRPKTEEIGSYSSPPPSTGNGMFSEYPRMLSNKKVAEDRLHLQRQQLIDECPIKLKYFKMIQNGTKTIEGRLCNGPFKRWRVGTWVKFKNQSEFVICEVTRIGKHADFATMLQTEGFKPCLPDVNSLDEAIKVYKDIPGYSQKERQFGVLAIHLRVVQT